MENSGPNKEPCGASEVNVSQSEGSHFTTTR